MADDLPVEKLPQDGAFVKKQIETPVKEGSFQPEFSSATSPAGGFKGFYQANKYYFWAIILGVVLIAVLSYFAFKKTPQAAPKEANVAINVDVPQTIPSGGEAVYKITVQNNDSQKLINLELELTYPDGAVFENSTPNPENISGSLFKVPDLISGQNAVVFVKAKLSGNVNDQKTLNIKLHYSYSNFNSEFIKEQTSTVTLLASNVQLELDGPATSNNAQNFSYIIKYQNNSDQDINSARIKMDYPQGFVFASASPQPDLGTDTWQIDTLAKGASGQIQIQGQFNSANPGETKNATAEFLILGQDGQFFTQNTSVFATTISILPLLASQALQPDNSNGVINPGQSLQFAVNYQNNGSVAATGVNIQVTLDSKAIDLSSISAQGGVVNNNTILWNAAGVPQLQSLGPNESGQLLFSVKLNNPAVKDNSKNLTLVSSIKIQSNEYDNPFPGNQLVLKISSPATLATGLTFSSGQLPPQVGKATTYKVKLTLTNSSNDFSNGLLTMSIPAGTTYSASGGEANNLQFDASTGKLTWNVGSLPANTGRFTQPRTLEFLLTFNPSASQANSSPTLVSNINFTATDLFTTQNVALSAQDITTADIQGSGGFGNGQVQQ